MFDSHHFSFLFLMVVFACSGCVSGRCYEDYHCPSPKICSPEGLCVFECVESSDCISGYECLNHVCVPGSPDDVMSDGVEPVFYCPAGMVMVEQSFCIDVYEAARPDSTASSPGVDESRAVSRKGAYPWETSDNAVAEAACFGAGKRLCEPAEWAQACGGPEKLVYAYGDDYEPETCNGLDTYGIAGRHLMPTGSFPNCTNDYGVFDMNGNVWEHVAGGTGRDVRGGAYNCRNSGKLHKCPYIPGDWIPDAQGFRCCREPMVWDPSVAEQVETVVEVAQDVLEPDIDEPEDVVQDENVIYQDVAYFDTVIEELCGEKDFLIGDTKPVDVEHPDEVPFDISSDTSVDTIVDTVVDTTVDTDIDSGQADISGDVFSDAADTDVDADAVPEDTDNTDIDVMQDSTVTDSSLTDNISADTASDTVPDSVVDTFEDIPVDSMADTAVDTADDAAQDVSNDIVEDIEVNCSCPDDMVMVTLTDRIPFCMDRYEASRSDSTATSFGQSTVPVSEPNRLPWYSGTLTLATAQGACANAGKRVCEKDEWIGSCSGTNGNIYVYGDVYIADACNGIDAFCYCDTTCSGVALCPYPHCRTTASPAGDGGPCGAAFHVAPTGSFAQCVNEWGAYDVVGNVWEVVDFDDGIDHFRGGAYNCSNSEILHRCDHDGTWGPSARGFRCCRDADVVSGD